MSSRHSRSFISAFAILAVFVAAAPALPQVSAGLDRFIEIRMQRAHVPGLAVGIVKDGKLVWSRGYGWADVERAIPATEDTLFMLASVSKAVTGTAVLQLYDAGLLDLDVDINAYLPFSVRNPHHPGKPITTRQLLTHTSSLRDDDDFLVNLYTDGDSATPLSVFLERYLHPSGRDYDPRRNFYRYAPGRRFNYSNTGYALLGFLAERVSHQPFETYCRDRLFTPLTMYRTSWRLADLDVSQVALPYGFRQGRYVAYGHYGYPDYPNGLLRSSVRELANFVIAHLRAGRFEGRRILKPATARSMRTVQQPALAEDMGLALFIDRYQGVKVAGHDGGDFGVSTQMWFSRPHGLGVILLTNGEAERPREDKALLQVLNRLIREAKAF